VLPRSHLPECDPKRVDVGGGADPAQLCLGRLQERGVHRKKAAEGRVMRQGKGGGCQDAARVMRETHFIV
jgi:hypothetical protein